jgi:hypothetical protein
MGRASDYKQVGRWRFSGSGADFDNFRCELRSEAFADGLGDLHGVAVEGFIHDECVHRDPPC